VYYADAVFQHLGDLVDEWMTFNEVISICELGYERDTFAPGVSGCVWSEGECVTKAMEGGVSEGRSYPSVSLGMRGTPLHQG
jgi:beta-glucosidase/6-phospho-beta-glucosidase/beta-galactosidase